jgi:hypothetical protein
MTVSEVIESVQYLVDEDGKRTAAVIQMKMWQTLLDLLNATDLAAKKATAVKTPEQVVAAAQARPLRSENVIQPQGSLLAALQTPATEDDEFDLNEWTDHWRAVEAEMKAITAQNDLTEGRN